MSLEFGFSVSNLPSITNNVVQSWVPESPTEHDVNITWQGQSAISVPVIFVNPTWYQTLNWNLVFDEPHIESESNDIVFGFVNEEEDGILLLFSGQPYPEESQITLVFGQTGYQGVTSIEGNGSIIVGVESNGCGELSPAGISSITVSVSTSGSGAISIRGNSSRTVDVTVSGTGEVFGNLPEITGEGQTPVTVSTSGTAAYARVGDSSITVNVTVSGFAFKDTEGQSSILVDVSTTGTGLKSIDAVAQNTLVSVLSSGTGVWTGGPEIIGNESTTLVGVSSSGSGKLLNPIFSESSTIVQLLTSGNGTSIFIYEDILGDSNITIDIFAEFGGEKTGDEEKEYIIEDEFSSGESINFVAHIIVDVDNRDYEIRNIKTNRIFLENFRRDRWLSQIEIGSVIKDEFVNLETVEENYKISRHTTLRKYGASEVLVEINISDKYRFIKNDINIKRLIDREFDRALLDTYALYELEFE